MSNTKPTDDDFKSWAVRGNVIYLLRDLGLKAELYQPNRCPAVTQLTDLKLMLTHLRTRESFK